MLILVAMFCMSFTFWWSWKLDAGPMIYRHLVSEKLTKAFESKFMPYFKGRDIVQLRFGTKNAHKTEKVPVLVKAGSTEKWLTSNTETGPVLVLVDIKEGQVSLFWDIPEDMPFQDSLNLLSDTVWDILVQYDDIQSIKNTYTN